MDHSQNQDLLLPYRPNVLAGTWLSFQFSSLEDLFAEAADRFHQAKYSDAEAIFNRLLYRATETLSVSEPLVLDILECLAITLKAQSKDEAALDVYECFLSSISGASLDHDLVVVCQYSQLLKRMGHKAAAAGARAHVLERTALRFGPDHGETIKATCEYGRSLILVDRSDLAIVYLQPALSVCLVQFGPNERVLHDVKMRLGCAYTLGRTQLDEAKSLLAEALSGYQRILEPTHEQFVEVESLMGLVCKSRGEHEEAFEWYEKAFTNLKQVLTDSQHPEAVCPKHVAEDLVRYYLEHGRFKEALAKSQLLFEYYTSSGRGQDAECVMVMRQIGACYQELGKLEEAETWQHRAGQNMKPER